jgi:hypothetical protein
MKKFISSIAIIAAAALTLSCYSEPTDKNPPSSGSQVAENGQVYKYENGEKYTRGDLKIYMAEKRDYNDNLVLTEETMLEIGTISNGEASFALPQNVEPSFLNKIDVPPPGMEVEPLGVEVWFYKNELRLIDNDRRHIGNLQYYKKNDAESNLVFYWYFSGNVKISGTVGGSEYNIDAKKGWNKVYVHINTLGDGSAETLFTTDLSKIPEGLKWLVRET